MPKMTPSRVVVAVLILSSWCLFSSLLVSPLAIETKLQTSRSFSTHLRVSPQPPLQHFQCLNWIQTKNCHPNGPKERRLSCSTPVHLGMSGFCELKDTKTNQIHRVMHTHCSSFRRGVQTSCAQVAAHFYQWSALSLNYTEDNNTDDSTMVSKANSNTNTNNGIVMSIYGKVLYGAYASIRILRDHGCKLPIEVWFKEGEIDMKNKVLQDLILHYNVIARIFDKRRNLVGYETKPYAVYHSSFQNVLLLDADNVPVRDPTYLFETAEFKEKGAIFWPDYWQSTNTHFNIQEKSAVWELLGISYVDMFEQESGQVLINKAVSQRALNVLMFYNSHKPALLTTLKLAWGDKDLFRFAWLKTNTSFHMIKRPPGSAGLYNKEKRLFCGSTMIQYDPRNEIVFLHRNFGKLDGSKNQPRVWNYIQEFDMSRNISEYTYVNKANGLKVFGRGSCWGFYDYGSHIDAAGKSSALMSVSKSGYSALEDQLLQYSQDAKNIEQ